MNEVGTEIRAREAQKAAADFLLRRQEGNGSQEGGETPYRHKAAMETAFEKAAGERPDVEALREGVATGKAALDEAAKAVAAVDSEAGQAALKVPVTEEALPEDKDAEIRRLQAELEQEREAREQAEAARQQAEKENQRLRKQVEGQQRRIETLESQVAEQDGVIQGLRAGLDRVNNETVPGLEARIAQLEATIARLEGQVEPRSAPTAPPPPPPLMTSSPPKAELGQAPGLSPAPSLPATAPGTPAVEVESVVGPPAAPAPAVLPPPREPGEEQVPSRGPSRRGEIRQSAADPGETGEQLTPDQVQELQNWARRWRRGDELADDQVGQIETAIRGGQLGWGTLSTNLKNAVLDYLYDHGYNEQGAALGRVREWQTSWRPIEPQTERGRERQWLDTQEYLKLQDKLRRQLPASYVKKTGRALSEKRVGKTTLLERLNQWRETFRQRQDLTPNQIAALVIYDVVNAGRLPRQYREILRESHWSLRELRLYQDWRQERGLRREGKRIRLALHRLTTPRLKRYWTP